VAPAQARAPEFLVLKETRQKGKRMTITTPMLQGLRKRSSEEIILACKAVGCPWDPYPPTVQDTDRLGRWWWFVKIRCLNCGSLKVEKYRVGDTLFKNRIGQPKYDRPPGWYEIKAYWGHARTLRAERGQLGQIADLDLSVVESNGNGNVVNLRAASEAG
jgi:hypothetical protein